MIKVLLLCAALLSYTWIGYGVLLSVLAKFKRVRIAKAPIAPAVTVIVAARNEEQNIRARVENLLLLDYPHERLEIMIASDGSSDRTAEIVREFSDQDVRLLEFRESRGRAAVHNDAVKQSRGEILIFTDAATRFEPSFLLQLVSNFADPRVGCVSGQITFGSQGASAVTRQRSLYWRYEYWLRHLESSCGILACASGPCMAVRKELFRPLSDRSYDVDFMTPLDVIEQDGLVVQEPAAIAFDEMFSAPRHEFRAQVRMVSRNLRGYLDRGCLLFEPRKSWFAWSLVSHKILRWLTPFLLLSMFAASARLAARRELVSIWIVQVTFYVAAVVGWLHNKTGHSSSLLSTLFSTLFSKPFAFCLANIGFFFGVLRCLRRQRITVY